MSNNFDIEILFCQLFIETILSHSSRSMGSYKVRRYVPRNQLNYQYLHRVRLFLIAGNQVH